MMRSNPYRVKLWDKEGLLVEDTILHPEDWNMIANILGLEYTDSELKELEEEKKK